MENIDLFVDKICRRLEIERLNDMQLAVVEAATSKNDIVLLSPTGSGKTIAFLLPLFARIRAEVQEVQALVLAPSRELAMQIEQVARSFGSGYKINCCYGGRPMRDETKGLQQPPALLIGTPGRILDHLERGHVSLTGVETLVLDEFDKSLELGFKDEMSAIISALPGVKRRLLTSATDCEIPAFTGVRSETRLNFLEGHLRVRERLSLQIVWSDDRDKLDTLLLLLRNLEPGLTLVFCNQRESVERVSDFLSDKGVENEPFHGGMEQPERERALCRFRNGSSGVFVSTDLAARGLDIPEIKYIIHYHLPVNEAAFIHRNGRTARMNASGDSFLILGPGEQMPDYLDEKPKEFRLDPKRNLLAPPAMVTLYISKGKKDKLSKMDIVGFMLQKGGLEKSDLGLIEVKDLYSFVAVRREVADGLLNRIEGEKIKNIRAKFDFAR